MARRDRLIPALLLAVLAGHALVLQWLAWQAQEQSALRLMTAPMFTRLLQQQAPSPVPATPAVPPARPRSPRVAPAIQSVERSTPQQNTPTETVSETLTDVEIAASPQAAVPSAAASAPPAAAPAPPPVASAAASTSPEITATASVSAATTATTSSFVATDSWPADTRLNYRVGGYYRGELHGSARVQWQRQDDRYQTRIDIDLGLVSLVMTSQGLVTERGLAPKVYEETRAGKRRSASLEDSRVLLSDGSAVPRPDGVQDTASQFVELSHRFASGQLPLEVGRSVSFWMARPGGINYWTYDVIGKEMLQTPQLGAVEAFHLKPRPLADPRGNITAEMWFAPSLQYLPVRIRVNAGDAHIDLFVEKIEQR